jgi:hypothetical protein
MTTVGNGAHVPDDQRLGIHVGGAHVEAMPLVATSIAEKISQAGRKLA